MLRGYGRNAFGQHQDLYLSSRASENVLYSRDERGPAYVLWSELSLRWLYLTLTDNAPGRVPGESSKAMFTALQAVGHKSTDFLFTAPSTRIWPARIIYMGLFGGARVDFCMRDYRTSERNQGQVSGGARSMRHLNVQQPHVRRESKCKICSRR